MTSDARRLAVELAAASDTELAAVFQARGVKPDVAWRDFFDAAEALIEPASIERTLPELTREEADAAHRGTTDAETQAALQARALSFADGTVLSALTTAAAAHPLPPAQPVNDPAPASDAAASAERAFTTLGALADLIMATHDSPYALLADGRLGSADRRRLIDAGLSPDLPDALVALATASGLARAYEKTLRVTTAGETWLTQSTVQRWCSLVVAFRASLPRALRAADGGHLPPASWADRYPWDPSWPDRADALVQHAQLIGLITDAGAEPGWATGVRRGEEPNGELLSAHLPGEVDRIFLQNDLTAIAPGALAATVETRLRGMAERESASQASQYRFTAESLTHAFTAGETEATIGSFLEEISLTGVPQPLTYLIGQTASRHGLIRVSEDAASGRSRVTSVDSTLIEALMIDHRLHALGFVSDPPGLSSRVNRDSVYWALTDARYPATLVDAAGLPVTARRIALPEAEAEAPDYRALIAQLREQHTDNSDGAWLAREIELAVRSRATISVEVAMPDGSSRSLTLEATGLGGGRVRGRDRAADVERTLPLSSIRSVSVIAPEGPPQS